jgi:hypothetical protein
MGCSLCTTTGASIFHTASFNSFSDLWGGNKRKKERQKASQTIIVEPNELPVVPKTTPDTKEKPEVPEL